MNKSEELLKDILAVINANNIHLNRLSISSACIEAYLKTLSWIAFGGLCLALYFVFLHQPAAQLAMTSTIQTGSSAEFDPTHPGTLFTAPDGTTRIRFPLPEPRTPADFQKIPHGAQYIDPDTGETVTKGR